MEATWSSTESAGLRSTRVRKHKTEPFGGVPQSTTMRSTMMEVTSPEDMRKRCVESRHEQKHADLLKDAIEAVPREKIDGMRETMARESADGSAPTVAPAKVPVKEILEDESSIFEQQASVTMAHEVKREAKTGIQSMFSAGSIEGPFPGSRSENGMQEALGFFTKAKPSEGSFQVYRPPKTMMGGGKFRG